MSQYQQQLLGEIIMFASGVSWLATDLDEFGLWRILPSKKNNYTIDIIIVVYIEYSLYNFWNYRAYNGFFS